MRCRWRRTGTYLQHCINVRIYGRLTMVWRTGTVAAAAVHNKYISVLIKWKCTLHPSWAVEHHMRHIKILMNTPARTLFILSLKTDQSPPDTYTPALHPPSPKCISLFHIFRSHFFFVFFSRLFILAHSSCVSRFCWQFLASAHVIDITDSTRTQPLLLFMAVFLCTRFDRLWKQALGAVRWHRANTYSVACARNQLNSFTLSPHIYIYFFFWFRFSLLENLQFANRMPNSFIYLLILLASSIFSRSNTAWMQQQCIKIGIRTK